ncbi:MAG: CCA tRNA nucleotidyltransferase [Rhodospirillaceae bacterium]|nr:CCA tRNA nucleotidyltransferase [Rhodospirillaceae bacterium]
MNEPDVQAPELLERIRRPGSDRVLDALEAAEGEGRFVGGCVRDALLDRPLSDIDIATPLKPEAVAAALEAAGIKAIPTGLKHGTITAVADHNTFEITTLRLDVETDGRHATVAFTGDWRADAGRRDFTMNALLLDRHGAITDYFGGLADARAGRVRFIGDAAQRIAEDVLRILRFFRFHAHYGQGAPDAEGLAACARLADRIPSLSGERVREETLKLLAAPDPVAVWHAMVAAGVARQVIGRDGAVERLAALVAMGVATGVTPAGDPVLRLASLLDDAGQAESVAERLRLSNRQGERLVAAVELRDLLEGAPVGAEFRRLLYHHGADAVADAAIAALAADPAAPWAAWQEELGRWQPPKLPIGGRDVRELSGAEGPEVGRLLKAVEAWWIDGDFQADKEACREKLTSLLG